MSTKRPTGPKPPEPLHIPLSTHDLNDEQRRVERELAEILANRTVADRLYNALPEALGGRVINIDLYRDLHPEYSRDGTDRRERRTRLTPATYGPAKIASKDRFLRSLAHGQGQVVLIMGGGPASGKSTSLRATLGNPQDLADIVYDTSLASSSEALAFVASSLEAGHTVKIAWVDRPFPRAIDSMVARACVDGRYLTLERMATLHRGSRQAILDVAEAYRSDERVEIAGIDNRYEERKPALRDLDPLVTAVRSSLKGVTHDAARAAFDAYRRSHDVPPDVERALRG